MKELRKIISTALVICVLSVSALAFEDEQKNGQRPKKPDVTIPNPPKDRPPQQQQPPRNDDNNDKRGGRNENKKPKP